MNLTMIHQDIQWNEYLNFLISEYGEILIDPEEIAVTDLVTQVVHQRACGNSFAASSEGATALLRLICRWDGTIKDMPPAYPARVFQRAVTRGLVTERCGVISPTPEGLKHVNLVRVQKGWWPINSGRF